MQRVRSARSRHLKQIVTAAAAGIMITATAALPAHAAEGEILAADSPHAIPGSYIVVLHDTAEIAATGVQSMATTLAAQYSGDVQRTYDSALTGFSATMSEADARALAADARVATVEQNQRVELTGTQTDPPWGLDRIDQRDLPLDDSYTYATDAQNVHAYVIDTGIRITHQDFGGRAQHGYDAVDDDNDASDCNGHGTHVAGTIGGEQYGVAKGVQLHGVRVLDCKGSGSYDGVIAGIDWVTENAQKPAVANMSLGGGASSAVDQAVQQSIASGITYALAAGNGDQFGNPQDACNTTPARTPEALTVGATDSSDRRASFSNYGTCLDIFAPGVSILSAWHTGDTATNTISGTSMASPHVAGAAALYLASNTAASPKQVGDHITGTATNGVVQDPKAGSPNKLLHTGDGGGEEPGPDPDPTGCDPVTSSASMPILDGKTVTSPITVSGCEGNASSAVAVKVNISHTARGDLAIDLVAPSGAVHHLKQAQWWDSRPDVRETYTVDASRESADGSWVLKVRDVYARDTGTLQSWTLGL